MKTVAATAGRTRRTLGCCLVALMVVVWPAASSLAASPPAVEARHAMVVSANRLASQAGLAMLRRGGNAIDAAVAMGYVLAVVDPCCGNIGGGGFLVAHLADGRGVFLNFRETAPAAATRDMYLDAQGTVIRGASLRGWRAVAVPGTVLGLDTALQRYGTLPRAAVMAPAIRLAHDGFVLSRSGARMLAYGAARLRRHPNIARIFLHPDGSPLHAGERLVQPELARTLQAIAEHGPRCVLSRPHCPGGRQGFARGRRHPHGCRPRRLQGDRVRRRCAAAITASLSCCRRRHPPAG